MRLTLRTLLAWMDDTLPPSQVREIGNQVSESPFARELVEKIRRVTRQRRLTVPKSTGPEWIDPNLVASYLDNDLDPEQVAEVEKQCLSIDVCLAEVASVHQILSLLGQRAKVPTEVKERMYLLVKGREARHSQVQAVASPARSKTASKPIQSWIERESVSHSKREKYGLLLGSLASIACLAVSAWYSLVPPPVPRTMAIPAEKPAAVVASADEETDPDTPESVARRGEMDEVPPQPPMDLAEDAPGSEPVALATPRPKSSSGESTKEEPAAAKPSSLPQDAVGLTEKGDNVLLRYDDSKQEWTRLADPTALAASDRLACLAPFRATIDLASAGLMMYEGSEIRLLSPSADGQSIIEPRRGRLKAFKSARGHSVAIEIGHKEPLVIDLSETKSIGVERRGADHSRSVDGPSTWAIYCADGRLTASQGEKRKTVDAPVVLNIEPDGRILEIAGESQPKWLNDQEPSAADRELREKFLKCFHPGRPVLAEVVSAIEDGQEAIRRLAISALPTLGDLSYVMPLLDRKDSPEIRRDTIAALREFLSQSPEALQKVRDQIQEEFGESTGPIVEKMLIGYTAEEAAQPGVLRTLVSNLEADTPSVGVRELSLDNLMRLSKRGNEGYDPDKPDDGDGLANWKRLLEEGQILPPSRPMPPK